MVKNTGLTLLSEGKTIRIKAHGYSMYPCIRPGSQVLIEPIKLKGPPVQGEIVAIVKENGLIIHRIIRIIEKKNIRYYVARGDSNAITDNPVRSDMIPGRVVGAESTGENPVPADIRISTKPNYIRNRIRVIGLILWRKLKY